MDNVHDTKGRDGKGSELEPNGPTDHPLEAPDYPRPAPFLSALEERLRRLWAREGLDLGPVEERSTALVYLDSPDAFLRRAGRALVQAVEGRPGGHAPGTALPRLEAAVLATGAASPSVWAASPSVGDPLTGWDERHPRRERAPRATVCAALARHLACEPALAERLVGERAFARTMRVSGRRSERAILGQSGVVGTLAVEDYEIHPSARTPIRTIRVTVSSEDDTARARIQECLSKLCGIEPSRPMTHGEAVHLAGIPLLPLVPEGSRTITPGLSVHAAALASLRDQYANWLEHEPAARLGEDPDALHDARVAVRRMRAVIRLHEPFLSSDVVASMEDLRWLGTLFGGVRDADVQLRRLASRVELVEPGDRGAFGELATRVQRKRRIAWIDLIEGLEAPRCRALRLTLESALARHAGAPSVPVELIAPAIIERAMHRFLEKRADLTKTSPPMAFHELRIRGKMLRYALEFLGPLYGKRAERMIDLLVCVQDTLGAYQDACVEEAWLERELREEPGGLTSGTAFTIGRLAERSRAEGMSFRRAATRLGKLDARDWRRLRRRMRKVSRRALSHATTRGHHGRSPGSAIDDPEG